MQSIIKIGTRESELALWQANLVKAGLEQNGFASELVLIKSEGDIDLKTPLYEMGVQGIFTRSLDVALLNKKIDIAVHSMKDVPTQLPNGIVQAAVLKRGNHKDLFVPNVEKSSANGHESLRQEDNFINSLKGSEFSPFTFQHSLLVATSSIRRKAQWLHRYPQTVIENIRGNVNTRLQKLSVSNWQGAIFAAAGLERINKRPQHAIELDWMLPAPAQGAVMVVARENDKNILAAAATLNDADTAACTKVERDFLRELLGGCSTPISALAQIKNKEIYFQGNIFSLDGKQKVQVEKTISISVTENLGKNMAQELLQNGGAEIAEAIRNAK
jgi:hydroxymethylbilane synthase